MPVRLVLEFVHHPYSRFCVSFDDFVVGRAASCNLVLNDSTVSRQHARILHEKTGVLLADLGSRNGTFVDDVRVNNSSIINGQRVRFGAVAFVAHLDEPESTEPQTASCNSAEAHKSETVALTDCLSNGEKRVFDLLLTGQPEKTIARQLRLSPHTVHNHVRAIFRELDVHSKTQLLAKCLPGELGRNVGERSD